MRAIRTWLGVAAIGWGCGGVVSEAPATPAAAELEPGHTACGSATCPAGRYCIDPRAGFCVDGCTSDENCLEGTACEVDPLFADGVCVATTSPPDPTEPGPDEDPLDRCLDAIDVFQSCGLAAPEASAWRDICAGLTETEQHAVAECAERPCDAAPDCLGFECFTEDQCDRGQTCLGMLCTG